MAIGIDRMATRAARVGGPEPGSLQRGYPVWTANLGRLPAVGNRSHRESNAHPNDGVAGPGLSLFKHRQRPERKRTSDAGRQALEPRGSLQYDTAAHRGGAAP